MLIWFMHKINMLAQIEPKFVVVKLYKLALDVCVSQRLCLIKLKSKYVI